MSAGVSPGRIRMSCGAGGKAGPADFGRKVTLGGRVPKALSPGSRRAGPSRLCQPNSRCAREESGAQIVNIESPLTVQGNLVEDEPPGDRDRDTPTCSRGSGSPTGLSALRGGSRRPARVLTPVWLIRTWTLSQGYGDL